MKTDERELARRLRVEGRSLKEITKLVGASKSAVSRWIRDIELTEEQHDALLARNPAYNGQRVGAEVRSRLARDRRATWQREGRAAARRGDPTHAAGCMLYWAEGAKTRNCASLTNADPEVLRFFAAFLRTYFNVPDERFRVQCHLFGDHLERQRQTEQFWLDLLGLPSGCLSKSMVNTYSKYSQRKRQNRLPYGTCRLNVCMTPTVQHIFGAIQEYGGFERPEWLD